MIQQITAATIGQNAQQAQLLPTTAQEVIPNTETPARPVTAKEETKIHVTDEKMDKGMKDRNSSSSSR